MSKTIPALPSAPAPTPRWWQRIGHIVGPSEVLVLAGLALWMWAFWATSRETALGLPAAILVWYGLPPRPWFIEHERKG